MRLLSSPLFVSLFTISSLSTLCQAGIPISQAISQLPACGTSCIVQSLPSSPCRSVTNTTCICGNEDLHGRLQDCIVANCTGPDAIRVGLVQAQVCDLPLRLRKFDIHILGILHGIALLCICLRIFSRWYTMDRTGLDDWISAAILPLYMGFLFCGHYAGYLAFGIDIWFVEPGAITESLKLFYAGETLYVLLLGLTKASILCFYLRLFPHQGVRRVIFAALGVVGASTTTLVLLQVFQCIPVSVFWEGWTEGLASLAGDPRCINVNALTLAVAAVSIALDLVILGIPIPVVTRLDRRLRRKAAGMFGLGVFILITSCTRVQYVVKFGNSRNPTWDTTDAFIWSGVEIAVSVVVISLPAIRVLVRVMFPSKDPGRRGGLPAIESARGRTFRRRLTSLNASAAADFRPSLRGGASSSRQTEGSRTVELKETASSSQVVATKFSTSSLGTLRDGERNGEGHRIGTATENARGS